jgi:hypothetical protein
VDVFIRCQQKLGKNWLFHKYNGILITGTIMIDDTRDDRDKNSDNRDVKPSARLNTTLDIKDLITIVSAAVSITFAWGVFNTRIAALEQHVAVIQQDVDATKDAVRKIEAHAQENAIYLDQVYTSIFKTLPRRNP